MLIDFNQNELIKNLCYTSIPDSLEPRFWSCEKCQSKDNCFISSLCITNAGVEFYFVHCKKCDAGWKNVVSHHKEFLGKTWKIKDLELYEMRFKNAN